MKRTILYQTHVDAGAKIGEYAGYEMPLFYPLGVMKEHLHTRAGAGLFDISHMLHIEISGDQSAELVSRLCPYDAASQGVGDCKYTFLLNDKAGIIDDLIVTRLGDKRFLVVANAGCAEKDLAHIESQASGYDVEANPMERGFLALQGPKAEAVLTDAGLDVAAMDFMTGVEPQDGWFVSRSGYTGEDGFEVALPPDQTAGFAEKLVTDDRVEWIGLAARDSLRLEAGLSLYGQDLNEDVSPDEAALMWAVPKAVRENGVYVGAEALRDRLQNGRGRMRLGLLPEGRPVRAGTILVNEEGKEIGTVTSGGFGPTLDGPMALGLVDCSAADQPIFADMRGKKIPMARAKLPFVPHNFKR